MHSASIFQYLLLTSLGPDVYKIIIDRTFSLFENGTVKLRAITIWPNVVFQFHLQWQEKFLH